MYVICNRRILTGSFQFTCDWKYQDSLRTFIYSILDQLHHPGKMKFNGSSGPTEITILNFEHPTIGTRFFCIFKSSNLKKVLCHPSLDKESKHLSFGTTTKTSCSLQRSFGINSEFCPVPVLQENPEWPGAFCRPPKIERDEDGWKTQPCTESV